MSTLNRNEREATYTTHPPQNILLQIPPEALQSDNEENFGPDTQVEDVVQPGDSDEHIEEELTARNFTPRELESALFFIHNPDGIKLANSIERLNEKMLDAILPEFSDLEIAKALDLISYGRDVRLVVNSLDPNRIESILSAMHNLRSIRIVKAKSMEVSKSKVHELKRFKVIMEGKTSTLLASDIRDACEQANPTGSKLTIEEVK